MGKLFLNPNRDMTDEETDLFIAACQEEARAKSRAAMGLPVEEEPVAGWSAPPYPDDPAADGAPGDPATAAGGAGDVPPPFEPAPGPRINGWTARRQRKFIEVLAQSGCVSEAAEAAGVTPRSAYRLRQRQGAEGFDAAWNQALTLATNRLTALAFERAIHGVPKPVWRRGEVVGEVRVPSERLLVYLLQHFDRTRYGNLSGFTPGPVPDPREGAREALPDMLARLEDHLLPAEKPSSRVVLAGDPPCPRDAV